MGRPESDIDIFSDQVLSDPYSSYKALRDLGPAVWLQPTGMFAVARYDDVRETLRNWEVFSSARGVAMNDPVNQAIAGNTLGSDPPLHDTLRAVLAKPLSPPAMRALAGRIESEARQLVERLVARKSFDAATDLAQYLPLTVISHLVGLPEEGREKMLDWGTAAFNTIGPMNPRCMGSFEAAMGLVHYATNLSPVGLRPDGWAAMALQAAERGEITHQQAMGLMLDYVTPSLDTTIFAISNAIWLFASHPEQWAALRAEPSLIPIAINEVLRIESPIQAFSRYVTRDHRIGDVDLPAGSRAVVIYGSANRDERKWEEPERFNIRRQNADHLAFGYGEHMCVGLHLARLEIRALLTALVEHVERFELGETVRALNNTTRGFEKVEVTVH